MYRFEKSAERVAVRPVRMPERYLLTDRSVEIPKLGGLTLVAGRTSGRSIRLCKVLIARARILVTYLIMIDSSTAASFAGGQTHSSVGGGKPAPESHHRPLTIVGAPM